MPERRTILRQLTDRCAVVEDSANGLRSAAAAGMWVVAVPKHGQDEAERRMLRVPQMP